MTGDVRLRERVPLVRAGRRSATYFLVFFPTLAVVGILAVINLLHTDVIYSAVATADSESVRKAFGASDLASYLTLSLDWRDGAISDGNLWIRRLWPPGAPAVLTVLDALPGSLIITGAVAAVVAWAGTAAAVAAVVATRGRVIVAAGFAALWIVAPMTLTYAWGHGLLFSDGLGVVCIVLALLALFILEEGARVGLARWRLVAWGGLAGACLAGGIYMRWSLILSVVLTLVISGLVLIVALAMRLAGRTDSAGYARLASLSPPLAAAILAFLIAVTPWATYRMTVVEPGALAWSSTDYVWGQRWLTDADLYAIGGDWLVPADANWSCDIDPAACDELRPIALKGASEDFETLKRAALRSIVHNPVGFVRSRIEVFASTWFRRVDTGDRTLYSVSLGWVLLGTMAAGAVLAVRRWRSAPVFAVALISMIFGQFVTLGVMHVEVRYLMPITALVLAGTALLSAVPPRCGPVRQDPRD